MLLSLLLLMQNTALHPRRAFTAAAFISLSKQNKTQTERETNARDTLWVLAIGSYIFR